MGYSISRRLVFWLAVPLMLLALCSGLVHYFNNVAPRVIGSDRRLKDAAAALAAQVADGRAGADPASPDSSVAYAVRDARGRLLQGDAQVPAGTPSEHTPQLFVMARYGGRSVRTLTTRVDAPGGPVLVSVADIRPTVEPAARYGLMSTLLWDFAQLDLTLVLVWVGVQLGLRPIRKLRDEIALRSSLDLRPIDAEVPREISPLVQTLNRLFAILRSSVQSQQQFIANTAHQLRTPITGMQAQLDLLIAEPAAQPVRDRLLMLHEGARQLAHTANQLLTLARAEASINVVAKKQPVRLDTLARDVAARHVDRALTLNLDLGVDAQPVSTAADPSLLDDLLSNLVDNALKYTPAGGRITVSAGTRSGRPCLAVEDDGPGIPEADRSRVRQRFYRLPDASGHGSGLGLAIVDEIAQVHGAAVSIDGGADGRGTRVLVQFP